MYSLSSSLKFHSLKQPSTDATSVYVGRPDLSSDLSGDLRAMKQPEDMKLKLIAKFSASTDYSKLFNESLIL